MKKVFFNKAFLAVILSFLLGTIIIVPNIIGGSGIYNIRADFNLQQIPFNKMINVSIREGSILWTWYNELGSDFIGTFSFYNLFSVFNIIGYIFPASWFEYLIGPIFILKYAVAGLTSYLFLKRYVKNKNYAVIGSLLYSFSGFQLTNTMFYHFHDVVALFPLLLYTLDNLMYDNKKGWFAIVVSLLAFTNWFFFVGEVIFVILYFGVKILTKEYKWNFRTFITVTFESLIGTLIAAIVLLPTFLFVLSNPRMESTWTIMSMFKYWNINVYLEIFRSFIFAPELMNVRSLLSEGNHGSVELYLPFVGIVLFVSYFFKNPKNWISILFMLLCICMCIPILNSVFFMFNSTYYARWFYMLSLIICLMSIKCLEDKTKINVGIIINFISYIVFVLGIGIYVFYTKNSNIVFDKEYLCAMIIISVISVIILCFVNEIKNEYKKILILILCIFIFVGIWGNYMTYKYKNETFKIDKSYVSYLNNNSKFKKYKNNRTNSLYSCPVNIGYTKKLNNIKSFNSNIQGTNFEFYKSIGYERNVSTIIEVSNKDLNDYLGVKYIITCNGEVLNEDEYKYIEEIDGYSIYYNESANDFGFAVEYYMSKEQYNTLTAAEKIKVLKNTIILSEQQITKYKKLYNKKEKPTYYENEFNFVKNGFTSNIDSSLETLAIYTIPYDKGWKAYINGKQVQIEKVDNGMMAVKINKGYNKIKFSYFPKGLKGGIVISLLSICVLSMYWYLGIRQKNHKKL